MVLKDFTETEKNVLALAVKKVGSVITVSKITENLGITKEEAEKIINSLITKGITVKRNENVSLGEPTLDFNYGLRDGNFIDIEAETNKYWDDYQDFIRGTVCP